MPARLTLERRAFRAPFKPSVEDHPDQTDFGNRDLRAHKPNTLRNTETPCVGFARPESGETSFLLAVAEAAEEPLKGVLSITQCLLQRLTVDLAQPSGSGLLFELGELRCKIAV